MQTSSPEFAYVDNVVAYHQYRDELGLTLPEARTNPDTLEVFEDLTQTVTESDELRAAYLGVLRSRGANRQAATERVRAIETEIVEEMHDLELIGGNAYSKRRQELATDEGVKKAAEKFVELFAKFIPKEELPKTRKTVRKAAPRKPSVVEVKPEVVQASRFVVEKDARGNLRINGTEMELEEAPKSLLDSLVRVFERDPELHIRADSLRGSLPWRQVEASAKTRGDAAPNLSKALSDLRASLHDAGLAQLIEADGAGRGRTYRAKIDDIRYVTTFDETTEKPKPAVPPAPTVKPRTQDELETLTEKLRAYTERTFANPEAGILISAMRRRVAKELALDDEESALFVNNMIRGGLLHVIGNEKGVRVVSNKPGETSETSAAKTEEILIPQEPEAAFSEDELAMVSEIVEVLSGNDTLRGASLGSLKARFPKQEKQVNALVRRLESHGYLELYENSSKRNRRRLFVRFPKIELLRQAKFEPEKLLKDIGNLNRDI